jgi:hypothetical protein
MLKHQAMKTYEIKQLTSALYGNEMLVSFCLFSDVPMHATRPTHLFALI